MKTIKLIELYNKIANGEIKDKTRFRINWDNIYRDFYYDDSEENQLQCLKNCSDDYPLYDDIKLNDEVEIIEDTPKEEYVAICGTLFTKSKYEELVKSQEDKKIEYIETNYDFVFDEQVQQDSLRVIASKINEIIEKVNGKDNE